MTERRVAGRPSKAFLNRARLVVILASGLAFIGSLAGVAVANPATQKNAPTVQLLAVQPPEEPEARLDRAPRLQMPVRPEAPRIRPLTRTRGS